MQKMRPNPPLEVCQRCGTHERKMVLGGSRGDEVRKLQRKVRGRKHIATRWIGSEGTLELSQGMW